MTDTPRAHDTAENDARLRQHVADIHRTLDVVGGARSFSFRYEHKNVTLSFGVRDRSLGERWNAARGGMKL